MKESIRIRNFGPIKDLQIDEIRPLTVLIGESASGKSTILKVVALFRYIYKLVNIRFYLKNANINRSPFRIRFDDLLKRNDLISYVLPNSEIVYTVTTDGNTYELRYNKKLTIPNAIANKDLKFFKGSFISENRNMIPIWASRVASNRGASLGFYFHETYNDFEEATNSLQELPLEFLGLKFKVGKVANRKKYVIESLGDAHRPIDLRVASSGVQTLTPLLAIATYYAHDFSFKEAIKRSILSYLYEADKLSKFQPSVEPTDLPRYVHLHVEEPELSLYPDAQIMLVRELVRLLFFEAGAAAEMGMMVATHSPYIVNYLNNLLQDGLREEADVYLKESQLAVYKVEDGTLRHLTGTDADGNPVVDAYPLSEPMVRMSEEYISKQR